jgi:hypothetical protein
MTPLTRRDVLAHQAHVPWPTHQQIEQDLLLCRAIAALFNDKLPLRRFDSRTPLMDAPKDDLLRAAAGQASMPSPAAATNVSILAIGDKAW